MTSFEICPTLAQKSGRYLIGGSIEYLDCEADAKLIRRIERQNGLHTLEAGEQIGLGSRSYRLVIIGDSPNYLTILLKDDIV